jgi:hypothetical protein
MLLKPLAECSMLPPNGPDQIQAAELLNTAIEGWILFDQEKGDISGSGALSNIAYILRFGRPFSSLE